MPSSSPLPFQRAHLSLSRSSTKARTSSTSTFPSPVRLSPSPFPPLPLTSLLLEATGSSEPASSTETTVGTDANALGSVNGEAAFSGDIEKSSGPGEGQASGQSDYTYVPLPLVRFSVSLRTAMAVVARELIVTLHLFLSFFLYLHHLPHRILCDLPIPVLLLLSRSSYSPPASSYNALGRDATGSFNGGANDPPNHGAGIVPS
jgi:hypothetical protein